MNDELSSERSVARVTVIWGQITSARTEDLVVVWTVVLC